MEAVAIAETKSPERWKAPPESFTELWDDWYKRLMLYAKQFAGLSDEDREEAIAELSWKIWDKRSAYRPEYAWTTWVYKLARNHCIDWQRKIASRRLPMIEMPNCDGTTPDFADTRKVFRPEQQFLDSQKREQIKTAIADLDQVDREILYLVYSEDQSLAETAGICGLALGTVKSRLSRAREKLRQSLGVDE